PQSGTGVTNSNTGAGASGQTKQTKPAGAGASGQTKQTKPAGTYTQSLAVNIVTQHASVLHNLFVS
ncbi:unnamed protein product, partial [Didymodactylos carnosus]